MKYLFLLAGLAVFGFASAQDDALHYFQKKLNQQNKALILPEYQPPFSLLPQQNHVSPQKEHSYILTDGNKVTILTLDNMPCIKPAMSQFNMPNAGMPDMLKTYIAAIPNPGFKENFNSRHLLPIEKKMFKSR